MLSSYLIDFLLVVEKYPLHLNFSLCLELLDFFRVLLRLLLSYLHVLLFYLLFDAFQLLLETLSDLLLILFEALA